MTLEELKAYKAKCDEVQSTIKRDIAYIEKGNAEREGIILCKYEELVERLRELVGLLPEDMPKHFGTLYRKKTFADGSSVEMDAGNLHVTDFTWNGSSVYAINTWVYIPSRHSCGIQFMVKKDGVGGHLMGKEDKLWLADKADGIYELAKDVVAECHKDYNNLLIKKNKEALERAEHLHNQEL